MKADDYLLLLNLMLRPAQYHRVNIVLHPHTDSNGIRIILMQPIKGNDLGKQFLFHASTSNSSYNNFTIKKEKRHEPLSRDIGHQKNEELPRLPL